MTIAMIYWLFLGALIYITPFHCVKIYHNERIQNLVCATAAFHSAMAAKCIVDEEGSIVFSWAHISLRAMMREFDGHFVVIGIKNNDFV